MSLARESIWEIMTTQINTSKNPMMGALSFSPFETKIMRNVPKVTSKILPKNIKKGRRWG
jgi:hypothetical protein